MTLMLDQLRRMPKYRTLPMGQSLAYPDVPRQKCDLWIGEPLAWALEVKMARFLGDNGLPDPGAVKDVISPFAKDRSALTDAVKLAASGFGCSRAILIYGFDTDDRPLELLVRAFELLARDWVALGDRHEVSFGPLVHPVHTSGRLFAWEVAAQLE